jgi:flagellin-like protein
MFTNEEAVSPVIGTILMVAVTVVLAALIACFSVVMTIADAHGDIFYLLGAFFGRFLIFLVIGAAMLWILRFAVRKWTARGQPTR